MPLPFRKGPGHAHLKRMESCAICRSSVMKLRRRWLFRNKVLPDAVSLCPGCWDEVRPRLRMEIRSIHVERIDDPPNPPPPPPAPAPTYETVERGGWW